MKLVILAGGTGTRLGLTNIPKPMVKIGKKPVLELQIELAKRYGIIDIIILSGFLSEVIVDYFGNGSPWEVNITHIREESPLGTAGAIKQLENVINERFMVFYGDTIMDINLDKLIEFDNKKKSIATLVVHPNDHPYDSDLVETDVENNVTRLISKPHNPTLFYRNLVNAALYILDPEIFTLIKTNTKCDFGKDIFPLALYKNKIIRAYHTTEYIKDMGTPERFEKTKHDFLKGKVALLNKSNKRKAIFLDRDGVINIEKGNLFKIEDFELIKDVASSIKKINKSNFLAVVITNQPVVAKGFCKEDELRLIHNKMEHLLGKEGAYVDRIYYCPHYPTKGFEGEVAELKIKCSCRKPEIGMVLKAAEDLNIDLSGSYFIGDSTTDIMTGKNAGLKTIILKTGYGGKDKKYEIEPDYVFMNLSKAIEHILE